MFTRLSQFTYGNYVIPNIDAVAINNNTALLIHIQKYEQEALRMVIGDCLYEEFISNLEKDESGFYIVKEGADEKWDWLLNGHNYESNSTGCGCGCGLSECNKKTWKGIITEVAEVQEKEIIESILAPYVFFKWSQNYRTINTGVGEAKGSASGTTQESSANKRTDAWNEFVEKISFSQTSLYCFLSDHKYLFPEAKTVCLNTITYWDI